MIVADTNIISYFWIPGIYTSDAERAYQTDPDWKAPLLWKSEFRNVLMNYMRNKLMTLDVAIQLMEDAESQMKEQEFTVISSDVLRLAKESQCSAYDCEFVSLAEELKIPLVTTDKKILSKFPSIAISLFEFSENGTTKNG